jgi:cell division protein FtsQ
LTSAGITLGVNIFAIDLASARQKLLENPWVESAEIVRRLPGSIFIRIQERKPRALVNLDVLYLVDDMGRVFKRWVRGDPVLSPVVIGISRETYIQS